MENGPPGLSLPLVGDHKTGRVMSQGPGRVGYENTEVCKTPQKPISDSTIVMLSMGTIGEVT